jgi:hypothetical protein
MVLPMNFRKHVLLLIAVALLTPVAAIFGLYDTSMEQVVTFLGPVVGAASAIVILRLVRGR